MSSERAGESPAEQGVIGLMAALEESVHNARAARDAARKARGMEPIDAEKAPPEDENGHWLPYPAAPWHMVHKGRRWTAAEPQDELRSMILAAVDEADNVRPPGLTWTDDQKAAVEAFAADVAERFGWLPQITGDDRG